LIHLYDQDTIDSAPWPETEHGRYARRFLTPLVREGTARFFSDRTTMRVVGMDGLMFPIAINEAEYDNSGNTSTFARYIQKAREGIRHRGWSPTRTALASGALAGLGALLKAASIDRCVYVGNWLILRGMEPVLDPDQAARLTAFLVERFPRHAVVFSAINPVTHHVLLESLVRCDYQLIYAGHTRMLLPQAPLGHLERKHRHADAMLWEKTGYQLVPGEQVEGCAPRLAELYRALNCEKHSTNPMVFAELFERALRDGTLTIRVARKDGRIDGFYGFTAHDGVLFVPVIGYDMSLSKKVGLYRMLMYQALRDALERCLTIENGAGADEFKSLRGDLPVPKYGAIQVSHLPAYRRKAWSALQAYANGPFLASARGYLRKLDGEAAASAFASIPRTFPPPPLTPSAAEAAMRGELESLRRSLDQAEGLEGGELDARVAALSEQLARWPRMSRPLEEMAQRLEKLAQRGRPPGSRRKKRPAK